MNQVADSTGALKLTSDSAEGVLTTPAVWGGLVLFGLSAIVWLSVLSRTSLSFAYPFASLTYVLILLADRFVLNETVPPLRWAGVFFIMVGIVLVAQTRINDGSRRGRARRRHRELQRGRLPRTRASRRSKRIAATSTSRSLVIDNASTDGSAGRAAVAARPWVRLIENPDERLRRRREPGHPCQPTAPFVLLLNPDTEWWAGTLARLVKLCAGRPRAGAIGPLIRNADGTAYPSGRTLPERRRRGRTRLPRPVQAATTGSRARTGWRAGTGRPSARWTGSPAAACCCRREAFDDVGLLDERFLLYGRSVDLPRACATPAGASLFTPELEVLHEVGVSTGRSRRMS